MQQEFGAAYVRKVRTEYNEVPGNADYCVYWFRRTHDKLKPGDNPLRQAQAELDTAVRKAYGMKAKEDPLQFLLELNKAVAERETKDLPVVAPGLPPCVTNPSELITDDCVRMPK